MKKGTLIAGAVASMFAMGAFAADPPAAAAKDTKEAAKVKCVGLNECKGKGACGGAGNACAGKNECKGKGISPMSEADCKAKKGTVVAEAPKAAPAPAKK
jgi:uncharacterized membrane protein